MPLFYRPVKRRFSGSAFDGEGAKRTGGRWNSKGVAVLYASDSAALGVLEALVHLRSQDALSGFDLCVLEIPDKEIMLLEDAALPPDWAANPPVERTAMIGDEWVTASSSLALSVPSVLVPHQRNLLINPAHKVFRTVVESVRIEPFHADSRVAAGVVPNPMT